MILTLSWLKNHLNTKTSINEIIEEFKSQLEKKYGQVNINLEDGSYTEIEKQDV